MLIFPAIDICGGSAVRLYRGDYGNKTVYGDPVAAAVRLKSEGASQIHVVDLDGAKDGGTPNYPFIRDIKLKTGLFCEVGGGIRDMAAVRKYLDAGVDRVILGTAAIRDPAFTGKAVEEFGGRIAVGVDISDGKVRVSGWTEDTGADAFAFTEKLVHMGVRCVICTDISRDGTLSGANVGLYKLLTARFPIDITASGGISSVDDIRALKDAGVCGAIIGKAYYSGGLSIAEATEAAK